MLTNWDYFGLCIAVTVGNFLSYYLTMASEITLDSFFDDAEEEGD